MSRGVGVNQSQYGNKIPVEVEWMGLTESTVRDAHLSHFKLKNKKSLKKLLTNSTRCAIIRVLRGEKPSPTGAWL